MLPRLFFFSLLKTLMASKKTGFTIAVGTKDQHSKSSSSSKLAARCREASLSAEGDAGVAKSKQKRQEVKKKKDDQSSYFTSKKHVAVEVDSDGDPCSAAVPHESGKREPTHWHDQVKNIELMRQHRDAPVDTMGCSSLGDKDVPMPVSDMQKVFIIHLFISD